ncbi:PBP superfamily domain [Rhizoctonia solani]|uniref:PBP superfamily domain n=1 Tax=Rhizoctonia solani TaxID=456999 RepID=A0A8H7LPU5_9AGAM|nr:PBP superfamily domain [Rhizoctonia solani]
MVAASLVLALGSGLAATALPSRRQSTGNSTECTTGSSIAPSGVYYGVGKNATDGVPVRLRISNGGAGLSGLVGALANAFITYKVDQNKTEGPFAVAWVRGDTTETIKYLGNGEADVGITYNKAAECQAVSDGVAARRVYGFRDHFYLAGPPSNPAGLQEFKSGAQNENILTQFQKIVRTGNNDTLVPPTRFLTRYDKSATNIKDSELFIAVGQVPWAYAYSKWYHQYVAYPIDALVSTIHADTLIPGRLMVFQIAAAKLGEYTITDRGTWLSTPVNVTSQLVRYNEGQDDPAQSAAGQPEGPEDLLLNPAFFLTGTKVCEGNKQLADDFLTWVVSEDGQKVIEDFRGTASPTEWLYTRAPTRNDLKIQNCSITGA